jgi:hypothetical protein
VPLGVELVDRKKQPVERDGLGTEASRIGLEGRVVGDGRPFLEEGDELVSTDLRRRVVRTRSGRR